MSFSIKPISIPDKKLAASIVSTDMSFKLGDLLSWDGVNNVLSSDLGTKMYAVFRNSANTRMELMEIDPTTIVNAGTAITILKRGLKYNGDRTTIVAGNQQIWVKGDTTVSLGTDAPQMFQAIIDYLDAAVIAGGAAASTTVMGFLEVATAAEINAGTATGGSGAPLAVTPDGLLSSNYGLNTPSAAQKAGLASTTASAAGNLYMTQKDIQKGAEVYAADAGSTDDYAITLSPAPAAYTSGMTIRFKANTANTGAATLNINSLGAKTLKKFASSDLVTGDILSGQIIHVIYDGTNFQLLSPIATTPLTAVASGQTIYDLGTASGNQNIAHGLGVVPKFSKLTIYYANSTTISVTSSIYIGSTQSSIKVVKDTSTNGAGASGFIVQSDGSGSNIQTGIITTDSTNIKIAWTKSGTPSGTGYILWEAFA